MILESKGHFKEQCPQGDNVSMCCQRVAHAGPRLSSGGMYSSHTAVGMTITRDCEGHGDHEERIPRAGLSACLYPRVT